MSVYRVPVRWTMYGVYEVESSCVEAACRRIAEAGEGIALPNQQEYVECSCYIARDQIEEENKKVLQNEQRKMDKYFDDIIINTNRREKEKSELLNGLGRVLW